VRCVIVVQCCQKYISKDKDFQATTLRAVGLAKHVSVLRDNGAALPKTNQ
jgi:cytochrome c-type biogenesis protein CcmE